MLTLLVAYFCIGLGISIIALYVVMREEERQAVQADWAVVMIVTLMWPRFLWKLITNNPEW